MVLQCLYTEIYTHYIQFKVNTKLYYCPLLFWTALMLIHFHPFPSLCPPTVLFLLFIFSHFHLHHNKCWCGYRKDRTFTHCLWEYKFVQLILKSAGRFSKYYSWNLWPRYKPTLIYAKPQTHLHRYMHSNFSLQFFNGIESASLSMELKTLHKAR